MTPRPRGSGAESWRVWKRWCSVCGKTFGHVYDASCEQIQCKCGAWLTTPRFTVLQVTTQETPSNDGASLKPVTQLADVAIKPIIAGSGDLP